MQEIFLAWCDQSCSKHKNKVNCRPCLLFEFMPCQAQISRATLPQHIRCFAKAQRKSIVGEDGYIMDQSIFFCLGFRQFNKQQVKIVSIVLNSDPLTDVVIQNMMPSFLGKGALFHLQGVWNLFATMQTLVKYLGIYASSV